MKDIIVSYIRKNKNLFDTEISRLIKKDFPDFQISTDVLRRKIGDLRIDNDLKPDLVDIEDYESYIRKVIKKYPDHNFTQLAGIVGMKFPYGREKIRHDIASIIKFGGLIGESKKTYKRR